MLLLIDIFSINKGRGYENPSLEIIVTERCSIGGCPLKEAYEHCFLNQSFISIAILISFMCYCEDYAGYFTVILPFLAFYFCSAYFIYLVSCKWYQSTFLGRNCRYFFFKVETYSGVFKPQRSVITRINPQLRKYKWFLSAHLLATLVTPVGTPSSGSASDNTCVRIDLDFLKPSLDKPIDCRTAIVSLRTTLGKILSST
jgi:hypothetical protein